MFTERAYPGAAGSRAPVLAMYRDGVATGVSLRVAQEGFQREAAGIWAAVRNAR